MKKSECILLFILLISCQNAFSQVSQQWAAMYNGPADWFDQAKSIAVDNSGNVYVTGFSEVSPGTGNDYDYITIKTIFPGFNSGQHDITDQEIT